MAWLCVWSQKTGKKSGDMVDVFITNKENRHTKQYEWGKEAGLSDDEISNSGVFGSKENSEHLNALIDKNKHQETKNQTEQTSQTKQTQDLDATQLSKKSEKLSREESYKFHHYCKEHGLSALSDERFSLQEYLERRKYQYLKDYYSKKDWEAEFNNFLKTPPNSQMLKKPSSMPLNSDEMSIIRKLLISGKVMPKCFVDFKNELEMRKAGYYNSYKPIQWNQFFLQETRQKAINQIQNTCQTPQIRLNDDFDACKCHSDSMNLKF